MPFSFQSCLPRHAGRSETIPTKNLLSVWACTDNFFRNAQVIGAQLRQPPDCPKHCIVLLAWLDKTERVVGEWRSGEVGPLIDGMRGVIQPRFGTVAVYVKIALGVYGCLKASMPRTTSLDSFTTTSSLQILRQIAAISGKV